jgi:hypothetical protein
MEHAQKIRFFAPHFLTTSFEANAPTGQRDSLETLITGTAQDTGEQRWIGSAWVEEFANCQISVEAIRRFTHRYGWLWASRAAKSPSGKFSIRLTQWVQARWQFRLSWDRMLGLPPRETDLQGFPELARKVLADHHQQQEAVDGTGGKFELNATWGMIFTADSLYHALLLKLLSLSESNKLRRCRRPDCDRFPYFIAEHAKQQYCGEKCAEWGQQQLKKAWWSEHGEQWRKHHTTRTSAGRRSRRENVKEVKNTRAHRKERTKGEMKNVRTKAK